MSAFRPGKDFHDYPTGEDEPRRHGLEGEIKEANTFYEDVHELCGKCDFVMANPPFNVDMVDAEKVNGDRRLPFGLRR